MCYLVLKKIKLYRMKIFTLLFFLLPFLGISQVQIGQDIDGEAAGDNSGGSLSFSSDGNILAIGALNNDGDAGGGSGHVRVYENLSGVWTQLGQDIDGEGANDQSGVSISLSSNGNILAIGALRNGGNGTLSGHTRIYENQSGVWIQLGQDIDGEAASDQSGVSVSLSSDGNIVAIGALRNSDNGENSGHVRVFGYSEDIWTQLGQDIDGESTSDRSGFSVSLSSDGTKVAIGAPQNNGNNAVLSGHVRVYENQSGVWMQLGQDIDGEGASDQSGISVSLSSDGNIVAIGGSRLSAGNAYVRVYENQSGTWIQIGNDIENVPVTNNVDLKVSLSSDGSLLAIGRPKSDNGANSGNAYIYQNQSGNWSQIGNVIEGEAEGDNSGNYVSLSSNGNVLAVGAQGNDDNGTTSGHVRVYDLSALLSIEESSILEFSIFPNPTKTQFTIKLNPSAQLEKVYIYNTLGQVILTAKTHTINTSKLASGSYIVGIITDKGKTTKKLIIK